MPVLNEIVSYAGFELRKLPPNFRREIGQRLEVDSSWKKLMCAIPSETNPNQQKYTVEHINLIQQHGQKTGLNCGEILLDEWSTSGKNRPKVETLLNLLIKIELYRAADYVATEILGQGIPDRPISGPAATVNVTDEYFEDNGNFKEDSDINDLIEKLNNQDSVHGNPISFSIALIETVTKNFSENYKVGQGAFGSVYKFDLSSWKGPELAVKLLNPAGSTVEEQFVAEIRILSKFKHENLVPLIGYSTDGPQYCLVYEYFKKGSLLNALANSEDPITWHKRLGILLGIAKGLHYLHTGQEKPLIHRDIKSANVLLTISLQAKIGDFGLAKSIASNQTSALTSTVIGTSAYMAPEAFRGDISPKIDIWSFGVIVLEILTGLPPHDESRDGNDIVTYIRDVVEDEDNISDFVDPTLTHAAHECNAIFKIGLKCIEDNKRKRLNSDQLLHELSSVVTMNKEC